MTALPPSPSSSPQLRSWTTLASTHPGQYSPPRLEVFSLLDDSSDVFASPDPFAPSFSPSPISRYLACISPSTDSVFPTSPRALLLADSEGSESVAFVADAASSDLLLFPSPLPSSTVCPSNQLLDTGEGTLHRPHPLPLPSPLSAAPATRVIRRRKRAPGLSPEQRAAMRKERHRRIDLQRRMREQAAIAALQRLIEQPSQQHSRILEETQQEQGDAREEAGGGEEGEKMSRSHVLEEAARKVEQLQRLVEQQRRTIGALRCQLAGTHQPSPPSDAASPSHALSFLPPFLSHHLNSCISSQALHSSSLLSASLSMLLISAHTGCVLDVNERALTSTGWERSHLIGRRFTPPWDSIPASTDAAWSDVLRATLDGKGVWVDGQDGCGMVPARIQPQYQRAVQLTVDLHEGRIDHVHSVPLRFQLRDGRVYEVDSSVWLAGADEQQDGAEGQHVRRPALVTLICKLTDAVLADAVVMD